MRPRRTHARHRKSYAVLSCRKATFVRAASFACIIAVFALAHAHYVSAQVDSSDGTRLYDMAYDRWKALPAAPYATYDAHFVATFRGKRQERAYTVAYRARDGQCLVTGTALDARDRPDPPQVTDRCFGPDFAFTFVPQRRNARGASALGGVPLDIPTPEPGPSQAPRTIGRVSVRSRPYAVTTVGDETIGHTPTVHLALRPLRDPARYILRDLWIDRTTNGVVRLGAEVEAGANLAHVSFVATYAQDAKTQTLQNLTGYVKAQLLLVKVGADVSFAQTSYAYPVTLPDWYFDKNAYRAHRAASPAPLPTSSGS